MQKLIQVEAARCQVHSDVKVAPTSDLKDGENSSKKWRIKILYDGDCPLCMRETMGRIHAILSDGTVITDVEAFRRLYEEVGLGWVYAVTKSEPVSPHLQRAKHRISLFHTLQRVTIQLHVFFYLLTTFLLLLFIFF
ncbi:uncharacterized protein LOC133925648 [Phragmites australis]|uniref:uncharacterized protein LOC133925648 n=1 Tax=Phragmites australis TaxID=29695 RepID=UPI002D79C6BC|nr:uncharacterized protein LOC133925648 [Phragmites australis]